MTNHVKDIQLKPVKSTIMMALPIIILLFLNSLYSVIDIYWIGGMGTSAVICMGYIANFIYTINKLGDGIGRSVNVLISNSFGAQEIEKTEKYAENGLFLILILSILLPIVSIPFIKPICTMADIADYSDLICAYLVTSLCFIILIMMNNYFSCVMGGEGDTKRPTIIITAGNILNIILDPILIFHFNMGMIGAAFATIIGWGLSCILFVYLYSIRKDTLVKFQLKKYRADVKIIKEIIVLAIPIVLDGIILSILGVIITYTLELYASPVAVFTYIIILNIQMAAFTPVQGITKGLGIVTGHLAGAKRYVDLKKTIRKIFIITLCLAGVIALVIVIFRNPIILMFSKEYLVLEEVTNMMMFVVIYIVTYPLVMGCSYVFLGLEKSVYTLIFLIFNLTILVLFIIIFNHFMALGSFGIFSAVTLSNIIEAFIMILVLKRMINVRIRESETISI